MRSLQVDPQDGPGSERSLVARVNFRDGVVWEVAIHYWRARANRSAKRPGVWAAVCSPSFGTYPYRSPEEIPTDWPTDVPCPIDIGTWGRRVRAELALVDADEVLRMAGCDHARSVPTAGECVVVEPDPEGGIAQRDIAGGILDW